METLIDRLKTLEGDISYCHWSSDGEPAYAYTPGTIPILLSAPHAAVHTKRRNGERKDEDEYTGGLARLVAELTGAHVLYVRRRIDENPNKDQDAAFKRRMAKIVGPAGIHFVMDIHGAKASRDFGIALGTNQGKSCSSDQHAYIIQTLAEHGLIQDGKKLDRLDVDNAFKAANNETITRYAAERLHLSAAQFEINAYLRIAERRSDASPEEPFHGSETRIKNTIQALVAIVQGLVD